MLERVACSDIKVGGELSLEDSVVVAGDDGGWMMVGWVVGEEGADEGWGVSCV